MDAPYLAMKLDDIGFYTLTDERAKNTSETSPLMRCELLLTDKCNLHCPYCRGMGKDIRGELSLSYAQRVFWVWISHGLQNVRFSGGEPTLYPYLEPLIKLPNDVLLNQKKVAGVLTENVIGKDVKFSVMGIGLNTNIEKFPEDLENIATSLRIELGRKVDNKKLLEKIVEGIKEQLKTISE